MTSGTATSEPLVKHTLADHLRQQIVTGELRPGVRIVEGKWAKQFGVAQASVREAINILAQEGFVTKIAGRSARVVSLTEQDVLHLYELRGAIEGLAASLAATRGASTEALENAVTSMRYALEKDDRETLLDGDLRFHLELCKISENPYILEHARRVLLPFFAFVRMRVITTGQSAAVWARDLEAHQRIIDLIRDGEGGVAEAYVRRTMQKFSATAYSQWEKKAPRLVKRGRPQKETEPE